MSRSVALAFKIAAAALITAICLMYGQTVLAIAITGLDNNIKTDEIFLNLDNNSQYTQYDQTVVSGSEVIDAVHKYADDMLAIVVRSNGISTGVNYDALLSGTNTVTDITAPMVSVGNSTWFISRLVMYNGYCMYNNNYYPLLVAGSPTEARFTAKYFCNLIKDGNGAVIGICFTEQ
jgi:hypothetical protein